MPYSDLLTQAFNVVRRTRALWVMGFLFALFGGSGSSGINFNSSFQSNTTSTPEIPAWFNLETLLPFLVIGGVVLLILAIVVFVVQNVAHAGLIVGTQRAGQGELPRWRELWRAGWGRRAARLFGLKFVLGLPVLLVVVLLIVGAVALAASSFQTLSTTADPGAALAGPLALVFLLFCCCLLPLVLVLGWALSLIQTLAARSLVLDGEGILQSIGTAWRLLRANPGPVLLFSIILGVIGVGAGIVLSLVTLIPLTLFGLPLLVGLSTGSISPSGAALVGIPLLLIVTLLSSLLMGPLQAYFETAWTLAWHHLTGRPLERPLAAQ